MASTTLAPQVYGADEVNAVVLDPGSYSTRIGFAGYDSPSLVLPSSYGERPNENSEGEVIRVFDENSLYARPQPNSVIKPILRDNLIQDWDGAVEQYEYMFHRMDVDPHEQPLMFTESTMNSHKNKVKALEVFLETEEFCGFYAVKQPTCVSFAHGRPNCLIVDMGHDLVTVTPVIDGICLKKQVMGTRYAGAFVDQQLREFLDSKNVNYNPIYMVKDKKPSYWENTESHADFTERTFDYDIDPSVKNFNYLRTLQEMKETLLECSPDDKKATPNEGEEDDSDILYFELPDGLNVPFSKYERQKLSNSLFTPLETLEKSIEGWKNPHNGNIIADIGTGNEKTSKEYVPLRRSKKPEQVKSAKIEAAKAVFKKEKAARGVGISYLVQTVLENLDVDLKPQLANNIVLTGATSLIPRLNERLHSELTLRNPSLKIRIHSVGNTTERKYSSWIGGSILASLGTFHQLWVSRAEYEEVGPDRLIVGRFR
ncbi:DEKNAAC100265 [Brettanomyces naardenensis]|uniref:DEKNAAC100265 n=1 Tax=Brettanomyces naardenensis TaxID=13370 RepID=A0A448YEF9_BRENA|nr:DEKNAAC100265 [Brettanomyces naardenensis]